MSRHEPIYLLVMLTATLATAAMGCAYETGGVEAIPAMPDPILTDPGAGIVESPPCVPRQTAFCECAGQLQGIKVCGAGGRYGACMCQEPAPEELESWQLTCTTDRYWRGGDEGSSRMFPGGDCIGCHQRESEGPRYSLAGTVYPSLHEEDDCQGAPDAIIRITGADGQVVELVSNDSGNFYRSRERAAIVLPYTAEVEYEGRIIEMQAPQTELNCATCHTEGGLSGAPGRVVIP